MPTHALPSARALSLQNVHRSSGLRYALSRALPFITTLNLANCTFQRAEDLLELLLCSPDMEDLNMVHIYQVQGFDWHFVTQWHVPLKSCVLVLAGDVWDSACVAELAAANEQLGAWNARLQLENM